MTQNNIGNGSLTLPLNFRQSFTIWGGPYRDKPYTMLGVKVAKDTNLEKFPAYVYIPTEDFRTPNVHLLNAGLSQAVMKILDGSPLYVGCGAGIGRTGLFLAVVAKAFGIENPVEYVREHYYSKAVETKDQCKFITEYEIPQEVKDMIAQKKWTSLLFFWRKNLTRTPNV
jgi:predicted alternative tryptophan synthase beta-subunit